MCLVFSILVFLFLEQKYKSSGLSLLELPVKHVHTIVIEFEKEEEAAYRKLEHHFAEKYELCKAQGVRRKIDKS